MYVFFLLYGIYVLRIRMVCPSIIQFAVVSSSFITKMVAAAKCSWIQVTCFSQKLGLSQLLDFSSWWHFSMCLWFCGLWWCATSVVQLISCCNPFLLCCFELLYIAFQYFSIVSAFGIASIETCSFLLSIKVTNFKFFVL